MIAAFLTYLIVGFLLMSLLAAEMIDADDLETPTWVNRGLVFFMAPWLAIVCAFITLFDGQGTEVRRADDLWDYLKALFLFVWLGESDLDDATDD